MIFYCRPLNAIAGRQGQASNRNPPTPPLRQGSALSSPNVRVSNNVTTSSSSMQNQLRLEDKTASNDQVQVFEAIEGTPLHFSNATSFSDLSVDDIDFGLGSGRISRDSNDGLIQHHPNENTDEQVETRTHR